jgi:hypothetical protein
MDRPDEFYAVSVFFPSCLSPMSNEICANNGFRWEKHPLWIKLTTVR